MNKAMLMIALGISIVLSQVTSAEVVDPTKPMCVKKKKQEVKAKKKAPARKVERKKEDTEVYILTSTLVSKNRTVAVINNRAVTIGDKVGKATVVEINPALVLLKSGKRNIKLALSTYKVKKTNASSMQLSPRRLQ